MADQNSPKDYTAVEMKDQRQTSDKDEKESRIVRKRKNLERPFDENFWNKVQDKFGKGELSWTGAMDEVRIERLLEEYKEITLQVIIRDWPLRQEYRDNPELISSLEHQINRFTEIILDKDNAKSGTEEPEEHYKFFRVDEDDDPGRPTILHLAAKQNFVHVAKTIVEHYPGLLYLPTEEYDGRRELLSVEIALKEYNDDTAEYLIGQMKHEWIHELFLCKDQEKSYFSFGEYIRHPHMKKTVVAVLDRLINPHWPYLPKKKERYSSKKEERGIERAWSSVPEDPMNYHFFYHLLDADEHGRVPKIGESVNENFTIKDKSNLHYIADSNNKQFMCCLHEETTLAFLIVHRVYIRPQAAQTNAILNVLREVYQEAIQHPVVRMLVMKKWRRFAHWWFGLQAMAYILFLTVMSFALVYGSTRPNPTKYSGSADGLRAFCEVLTVIMIMFYVYEECLQADKEGVHRYLRDPYNYFDWFGLILTFLVIPLRFAESQVQWTMASIGFLFNFLRVFKFSCVTRTTGLYTKTLAKIVYRDITRFMVLFAVIFIAFCGSLYISLRAMDSQKLFSGFESVMLAGIRALVEQNPVDDDYSKFKWLSVLLILVYMGMVIVILLNILIAQLSYTYAEAKKMAKLQYDIDRVLIVTRLEHSRLSRFNLRVKYYKEGDWIGEVKLAKELLEYSEDRYPWESIEEKLNLIRDMMRKVIKRLPVHDDEDEI